MEVIMANALTVVLGTLLVLWGIVGFINTIKPADNNLR